MTKGRALDLILKVWGGDPLLCPCCKGSMKAVLQVIRREEIQFFLHLRCLGEGIIQLPRPPPRPFEIDTMERIEPPRLAVKEWIPAAPLWPGSQQDFPPDLVIMIRRPRVAIAFPARKRISTGSTVPGSHPIRIPTVSTRAGRSSPRRSS